MMPQCASQLTPAPLSATPGLRISYAARFTKPLNVGDNGPAKDGTGHTSTA